MFSINGPQGERKDSANNQPGTGSNIPRGSIVYGYSEVYLEDGAQGRNRTGTPVKARDFKFSAFFLRVITNGYF